MFYILVLRYYKKKVRTRTVGIIRSLDNAMRMGGLNFKETTDRFFS